MHIPNGFVNAPVAISTGLLAVAGIGFSFWRTRRTLPFDNPGQTRADQKNDREVLLAFEGEGAGVL